MKEGEDTSSTKVAIGFHYVAVDTSKNPKDKDGDGTADYLEDNNGSGVFDVGEFDWQVPDLKVVVANMTKITGTANPAFANTISGVRAGDSISISYSTQLRPQVLPVATT